MPISVASVFEVQLESFVDLVKRIHEAYNKVVLSLPRFLLKLHYDRSMNRSHSKLHASSLKFQF